MARSLKAALAALALLLGGGTVATSSQADHLPREGDVRFKVTCNSDHAANDDPIVFPNQPGASHLHDFVGAHGVTAATTSYTALTGNGTKCNDAGDEAAYWTPALYANGQLVPPNRMTGYYRLNQKVPPIEAYPNGLKVIAGYNAANPGADARYIGWKCVSGTGNGLGDPPPASCAGNELMAQIRFPDCWVGKDASGVPVRDSADHRSHMAYAVPGPNGHNVCPPSHPVQVPSLTVDVIYITAARPITLASGGHNTLHGDFFNGWNRPRLLERIETCLNGLQRCGSGG